MIEKITTKYPDFDDLKYTINQLVDAVNWLGKSETEMEKRNLIAKALEQITALEQKDK